MNIEDNIEKVRLIDTYGSLLTTKQYNIVRDYFFDNLTLAEIGDNYGISRQAVSDSIGKSLKILIDFEDALHICKKYSQLESDLSNILNITTDEKVREKITEIIDYIRS